jgi:predicted nucleotide-binding protein
MLADQRNLFVFYERRDVELAKRLVLRIRRKLSVPVKLWMDLDALHPGDAWTTEIENALTQSLGLLFFISHHSGTSTGRAVLQYAIKSGLLVLPVLIGESPPVPEQLAGRWQVRLAEDSLHDEVDAAAAKIAEAIETLLTSTQPPPGAVSAVQEASTVAARIAEDVRASTGPPPFETQPKSVFVVHGHDGAALAKLEEYLASVGIAAVVLSRHHDSPQSLFQKFMSVAAKARFAIVVLCADDYGASRKQYDAPSVGDRALQFRARQNVILELGFFYGRLGWENVFVVYQEPDRVFPNFERPSDLDGVVFDSLSEIGWRAKLGNKLSAAGFDLAPSTS